MSRDLIAWRPRTTQRGIGVDVGGTFTDVILQRPTARATIRKLLSTPPRLRRGGRRARSPGSPTTRPRRRTSSTGRRWRRTRCSSGAARARRSSRPPASATCSSCAACASRTCTTRSGASPTPLVPRRLRFEVNERVTADGDGAAPARRATRRARVAARLRDRRRRVGRGLPAALVPLPGARGAARRDPARGAARRRRSRSRARSCASSASTSAPRRRSSTPTCGR